MKNKKPLNERIQVVKTLTQSQKHLPTCLSRKEIARAAQVGDALIRIMQKQGLIERINDCDHWVEMDQKKENELIVNSAADYYHYKKKLNHNYKTKPKQEEKNIKTDSNAETKNDLNAEEFLLKMINHETRMTNLFIDIIQAFRKYLNN
ncbi:MAG: hypothetical protein EBR82_25020 [Caulobacteraceae bacterium]|nr:hypothetical protein [Caulobacteraceae bacterium]